MPFFYQKILHIGTVTNLLSFSLIAQYFSLYMHISFTLFFCRHVFSTSPCNQSQMIVLPTTPATLLDLHNLLILVLNPNFSFPEYRIKLAQLRAGMYFQCHQLWPASIAHVLCWSPRTGMIPKMIDMSVALLMLFSNLNLNTSLSHSRHFGSNNAKFK